MRDLKIELNMFFLFTYLYTPGHFHEFSEYFKNNGVVIYFGDLSFKMPLSKIIGLAMALREFWHF